MSKVKHLYILRDVKRIGNRLGLTLPGLSSMTRNGRFPACPDRRAADDPNRGRQFAVELTAARWEHGLDILDRNVVASCAARSGLEANVADAVDNPKVRNSR
jgi:predicted DsbA family dithiol-disulfide isomerase